MGKPDEALGDLSRFAGHPPCKRRRSATRPGPPARAAAAAGPPAYELSLTTEDISEIEKIAGEELRRLGYTL